MRDDKKTTAANRTLGDLQVDGAEARGGLSPRRQLVVAYDPNRILTGAGPGDVFGPQVRA